MKSNVHNQFNLFTLDHSFVKSWTQLEKRSVCTYAMRTVFFMLVIYWDCRSIYIVHEMYTEEFDTSEMFCLQQFALFCSISDLVAKSSSSTACFCCVPNDDDF
jgi:hypothetical protein